MLFLKSFIINLITPPFISISESESLPPLQIFPNRTSSSSDQIPLVELPLPDTKPYKRIAAECFTMTFDCKTSPSHMCCPYHS